MTWVREAERLPITCEMYWSPCREQDTLPNALHPPRLGPASMRQVHEL